MTDTEKSTVIYSLQLSYYLNDTPSRHFTKYKMQMLNSIKTILYVKNCLIIKLAKSGDTEKMTN